MKISMSKEILRDIKFYYFKMELPLRKIVKLVKIMWSEGVHFENAKQILSERKMIRQLESEQDKWSSRLNTLKQTIIKMGSMIMSPEMSNQLALAYPKQSQIRVNIPDYFTLSAMDIKDAEEVYQIMYDLFNKGWSFNRNYDDPTFYYFNKQHVLKWASHPRETEFDFRNDESKRSYSRENYSDVMKAFSGRRRVCSYEDFLEFCRFKGMVGGGKDGPGNLWDESFSRGIPPPKDGYNYNEGFVFAELKMEFHEPSTVSLPVNCFDVIGSSSSKFCDYEFKIHNRVAFEDNKHAFENFRLVSVKSEVNVKQDSPSMVLINESSYKYSCFNGQPEFVKDAIKNSIKATKCIEGSAQFSLYTDAWKYIGCKEAYGDLYTKSMIHGLEEHLYYNVLVDPGKSPTVVTVYFIFKVQFFSRFLCSVPEMNRYYDIVDGNLCAECDDNSEAGDNVPTKDIEEENLSYDDDVD